MMAKTTKKSTTKPIRKTTTKLPPALKENMAIETADLDVHIEQMTERLNAAASTDIGDVIMAGRNPDGSGRVLLQIGSTRFVSNWPEWAYGVAEGALHFNKKLWVYYNNEPFGDNLLQVFCMNTPVS